jgi:SPP1 gp7 family putative phage head morphogenesis protein
MPIGENIQQPGEPTPAAKYFADLKVKEARKRAKLMRGHMFLRQKFLIAENIKSKLEAKMKKSVLQETKTEPKRKKKNKKKDKVPTAFLRDEETKVKYADMVNKAIDHRAGQFKKALGQLATRQKNALIVKLKNSGDLSKNKAIGTEAKKTVAKFFTEQEEVWAEFAFPFMSEYARQAGTEAMAMVNPDKAFSMSERVQAVLKRRSTEFGLGVNGTTRDKVSTAISDGLDAGDGIDKLSARITEVYAEFPRSRAELIARTESTAANNEGFLEAYKQSGVATHKEWVNAGDDRVRDEHQNGIGVGGEIVPVNRTFTNGLMFPQEPNCRCVIAPAFEQ